MRKKILGAANMFMFCILLIVTSNIQEAASNECNDGKVEVNDQQESEIVEDVPKWKN